MIRGLRADGRYPLQLVPVEPDRGLRFQLRTGGAGFGVIRLTPARTARIRVDALDPDVTVRATVVRLQ